MESKKKKQQQKKHSKSCREQHLEKQRHLNIRQIYVQCAKSWQGAWLRDGHKKALSLNLRRRMYSQLGL